MTAINIVNIPGKAVHLISDTAAIDPAGVFVMEVNKVISAPQMHAAFAVNGTLWLHSIVSAALMHFRSYDELRNGAGEALRSAIERLDPALKKQVGANAMLGNVALAGWSEQFGPGACVIATHDLISWLPAWRAVEIPNVYLTPTDAMLNDDYRDVALNFSDEAAAELITRQRAIIAPSIGAWQTSIVGGAAQVTTIDERGISIRIVKRFGDTVGQIIGVAA